LPEFTHKKGILGILDYPAEHLLDEDVQVLQIVANQIAIYFRLEQAQLAEVDSRRLDDELVVTSQIQDSFLPTQMPQVAGLDFAARLKPASHVGGDFYDIFDLPDGLAIIIGDVAGKGIPAALLSALIHATLKSEVQHHQEPADLLQGINHLIYDELDRTHTFITAFLAVLQTNPLRLRYASAGHTVTLLWQAESQNVIPLTSTGLPLGVAPQVKILQKELPLQKGDVLLLYSDGITEAENENGRVFGMQAMVDLLTATHTASASQQIAVILDALDLHRGALPLSDDVAIFLTQVESGEDAPQHVFPFVYPAERASARALAMFSRRASGELEFADKKEQVRFLEEWELAVSEIATNIVLHAYKNNPLHGRIQGRLSLWSDYVRLDLIDSGLEFVGKAPHVFSPENPPEGGYGLIIARQLLDVCEYTRLPGGRNHWQLEKHSGGK
jgi:serine phosphatase RsbU (regulator of sigma subunit)/anti-sigma regulatory factor (Ser/Thr protein kinase)